jgi:hypothetical protein
MGPRMGVSGPRHCAFKTLVLSFLFAQYGVLQKYLLNLACRLMESPVANGEQMWVTGYA